MAVTATTLSDSTVASSLTGTSGTASEQRFLKLLVTQLNNQDPLNPLDNAELTSQLAQLSTVSGIEQLNAALQSLINQSSAGQILQAASLIGRTVLVPGNTVQVAQGAAASFGLDIPSPADSVKIAIADAGGRTVRTLDMTAQGAGLKTVSWDGRDDSGAKVSDGAYRISAVAAYGDKTMDLDALTYAQVVSVAQNTDGISLDVGHAGSADLRAVKLVR